jgi:hypothetical protein
MVIALFVALDPRHTPAVWSPDGEVKKPRVKKGG